ncbi:DEAD-domain-containing protein [Piromyces finnis]|uniref:RNA helicase n=1 Tax=Piromyces finnis TaxID=1754191 RepID=A0A1Y1VML5_9FUNG|nr:DEAD-domain-containing protein [Piromyces finnis]|eukprot:ORX60154.1 DEAD-domain-containing protein [Piromyces finnis]
MKLHQKLLENIYRVGFVKPSKIQEKAIPLLLHDPPTNLIGQSQSGTGKTAAFTLAMLSRINVDLKAPQAIVLAPARELARQILTVVQSLGQDYPASIQLAVKDSLPKGGKVEAHIIIGTPGTIMDLIRKRRLSTANVRFFVLDEADNMLDLQGLGDQSIRIRKMVPATCQIALFSATFSQDLWKFALRFAPNANQISLKTEELSVEGIKQFYMDCKSEEQKFEILSAIYGLLTIGQSIIFVSRRDVADMLGRKMTNEGHKVIVLHGQFEAEDRDKVMDDFRSGKAKVLITTNVLARGIDVLQVNLVINYDLPLDGRGRPDPETYLHRIGRTGRFGRTGVSINFVHDEKSFKEMKAIEKYFGKDIIRVPTDDYDEIEKILKDAIN